MSTCNTGKYSGANGCHLSQHTMKYNQSAYSQVLVHEGYVCAEGDDSVRITQAFPSLRFKSEWGDLVLKKRELSFQNMSLLKFSQNVFTLFVNVLYFFAVPGLYGGSVVMIYAQISDWPMRNLNVFFFFIKSFCSVFIYLMNATLFKLRQNLKHILWAQSIFWREPRDVFIVELILCLDLMPN